MGGRLVKINAPGSVYPALRKATATPAAPNAASAKAGASEGNIDIAFIYAPKM